MTAPKTWRADWPADGGHFCMKHPRKPFRHWLNWACPSRLTLKQHRQFGIADGKDPLGQVVQGQTSRIEFFGECVKHRGQIVPRRQTMFAGSAIVRASQILVV